MIQNNIKEKTDRNKRQVFLVNETTCLNEITYLNIQ